MDLIPVKHHQLPGVYLYLTFQEKNQRRLALRLLAPSEPDDKQLSGNYLSATPGKLRLPQRESLP
jgi:hypothetical protein